MSTLIKRSFHSYGDSYLDILAEVALSEIGSMSMQEWIQVITDLNTLILQGYGAGTRGEVVGLVLLLLARYSAVRGQVGVYLSKEIPSPHFLVHLFCAESVRTALSAHVVTSAIRHATRSYHLLLSVSAFYRVH